MKMSFLPDNDYIYTSIKVNICGYKFYIAIRALGKVVKRINMVSI